MHPGDESGSPGEMRVTDRRRFTETGDVRDDASLSEAPAAAAAVPAAPAALPAAALEPPSPQAGTSPSGGEAAHHEVMDLGIEAVFFVFYQSALIALGAPEVTGDNRPPDLVEARQAIEFLRVLESKTAGNLNPEEAATIRQLLDDVQMRFVHVARTMAGGRP